MKTRLAHLAEVLRSGYLFIPGLFLVGGIALAFGLTALDRTLEVGDIEWGHPERAQGARLVLSTIAGSIITTAGIVFSITIAALTQASSQFGPRLLRGFMRDPGKQIVLGTFVATFVYCLLVLRTIQSAPDSSASERFVPHVAVAVAIVLAVISLGVLIYFIHNVAVSLQAPSIVAAVAHDLDDAIERTYPETLGEDAAPAGAPDDPQVPADACPIRARRSGYVQAIDGDSLLRLAERHDVVVCLRTSPGRFTTEGQELALVWPAPDDLQHLTSKLCDAVYVGAHRTPEQDVSFALHQLVEVAVRALSTGVNDPFTAIQCVDWLGHALARIGGRKFPSPLRRGKDGSLRLIAPRPTWDELVDAAFDPIRLNGRSSLVVMVRLLDTVGTLARLVPHAERRKSLARQATLLASDAREAFDSPHDRQVLEEALAAARQALEDADSRDAPRGSASKSGPSPRVAFLRRPAENA